MLDSVVVWRNFHPQFRIISILSVVREEHKITLSRLKSVTQPGVVPQPHQRAQQGIPFNNYLAPFTTTATAYASTPTLLLLQISCSICVHTGVQSLEGTIGRG